MKTPKNKDLLLKKLNSLSSVPLEEWHTYGINLKAASTSADGIVSSGITREGVYFFRCWNAGQSEFVMG